MRKHTFDLILAAALTIGTANSALAYDYDDDHSDKHAQLRGDHNQDHRELAREHTDVHEDLFDVHRGTHVTDPYMSRGQDRRLHRRLERELGWEHRGLSREHGYRHAELRDDHDGYHDYDDDDYSYGAGEWRNNGGASYFEFQYRR